MVEIRYNIQLSGSFLNVFDENQSSGIAI